MALDWTRTRCSETELGGSEGCSQVENQMVAFPFSCTSFTPCAICPLEEPQRECLHPPQPVLPDYPGAPLARASVAWAEVTPSAWYPKSTPLDPFTQKPRVWETAQGPVPMTALAMGTG